MVSATRQDMRPTTHSQSFEEFERTRALAILETARGQARLQQTGLEVELRCVLSNSAGRGLHESAEAQDANLIVVGSSRRGLLGRVLMGGDTRAALNGAPASVAIAPAGYSEHPARPLSHDRDRI